MNNDNTLKRPKEVSFERPQNTLTSQNKGVLGSTRGFIGRVRSGDLGMLPVVAGLLIISAVFSLLNPVFFAPNNLVNLIFDASSIGLISLGVVCVLLLGEIDLSVGSMSGLSSAIVGVMWVNTNLSLSIAIFAAIISGVVVGLIYGFLRNFFEMPSFVASLAGLLTILGLQLYLLGTTGSINFSYASPLVRFGQTAMIPAWLSYLIVLLSGLIVVTNGVRAIKCREAANLSRDSVGFVLVKSLLLTLILYSCVFYLNLGRGVPLMFGIFVVFIIAFDYLFRRTKWGRLMFAVGGNAEAARRSGINVKLLRLEAFVICSSLAAIGGIFAAARLASASQQAGTGDVNLNAIAAAVIGGTSLFGGRGSAWSALLGVIVIQAISNGLTLLDLSSSLRYMITGGVLVIAVIVDSLARRSRTNHGRA